MAELLQLARSIEWGKNDNEEKAIVTWNQIATRTIASLEEWCTVQNDASSNEVDVCLQAVEFVISALADSKIAIPAKVLSTIVEQLPTFDLLVMERKSLHFKLMSLVWKGVCRLVQGRSSGELATLDSETILRACIHRTLHNVGRNTDEEKKIRTFFLSQLTKLFAEKLPNRSGAFADVIQGLVKVNELDAGSADAAIVALARDPESTTFLETLASSVHLVRLYLSQLSYEVATSATSLLTGQYDSLLPTIMRTLEITSPDQLIEHLLACSTAVEFTLKCHAAVLLIHQNQELVAQHASTWTLAAIQLLLVRNVSQWSKGDSEKDERVLPFAQAAWTIDPTTVISAIRRFGPFSSPLSLLDWARISFIRSVPDASWLSPLAPLFGGITLSSAEISKLGMDGHRQIVFAKIELASVLGMLGMHNVETVSSALIALEYAPQLALEAICYNSRAFTNAPQLVKALEVCRPYHQKSGGWHLLLKALRYAPCLQQKSVGPTEDALSREIIELMTIGAESSDRLVREETYSSMADLLSLVELPRLRELVPPGFKQEFMDFLRNERRTSVPIPRQPCTLNCALKATVIPAKPPILTCDSDDDVSSTGENRSGDVDDSISRIKRLCTRIPLHQLNELENSLVEAIREERRRRGTSC